MKNIWLIGAGIMAQDYIKVLNDLDVSLTVVGRGEKTSLECNKNTGCDVFIGGISKFLSNKPEVCSHAVVAVNVETLFEVTKSLLQYGVKNILLEKPGAINKSDFKELIKLSKDSNASIIIAYNRRFYAATLKAEEIILEDDGVTSFNFEFTEWAHTIEPLNLDKEVKGKWFLGNSTHVVDLAFFLGGKPSKISTFSNGSLDWHNSSSNFSGAGISDKNALFSYQANWESAGRWSVEILTKKHRLIFRPMEKLQVQNKGSITQTFDESIDYSLDDKYKPGLYIQTKNFLDNNFNRMCTLQEQYGMLDLYYKIANYKD